MRSVDEQNYPELLALDQDPRVPSAAPLEPPLGPCVVALLAPLALCLADPLVSEVPFAVEISDWKQCSKKLVISTHANASENQTAIMYEVEKSSDN